ncbi:hypothetical protein BN184_1580003 [Clostridioides difficile T3]|nr:hypothetical protein BN184_1580003 [Clostridioides difficile T3]
MNTYIDYGTYTFGVPFLFPDVLFRASFFHTQNRKEKEKI